MLEHDDESLPSLGHDDGPLSGLRDAAACVLAADVEEDGSYVGVEVVADDKVALFPVGGGFVIEMIEDLIEPVLLLVIDEGLFGVAAGLFKILYFFAGLEGDE